VDELITHVR